ncbi:hypothetical protein PG985_005300 [Apiospora marii]|uniref:uncharacterized protein n=1 Tax=Apiospora marii TaxID=335849 RepID=UPI00312EDFA7
MSKPSSKRTLLWDWTLTRDHDATPALQAAAAALAKPSCRGDLPFRPMIRTPAQLEGGEWDMIRGSVEAELRRDAEAPVILHTFNEPERIPLSVDEALRLWRTLILPLRQAHGHRVKLVSPACASDPPGSQWLDAFMAGLPEAGDRPDILGLHFYTMPDQSADQGLAAAKAYFEERHVRFGGLPVIISELASTSRDPAVVDRFSRELARWLEGRERGWVVEYGFFGVMREVADGFVSPAGQMLDGEGGWTGLGRWWVGLKPMAL